jgi:hypothetical protein
MSDISNINDIGETKRKLASIQRITKLSPIEGADRIVVANILGWECVVKKDEFAVGDLVVYFEIDSILPERPEFEFMRDRKFRVKSIKLKKQISQGLVMPLSILPADFKADVDMDVTELLGVKKHDLQAKEERDAILALQNQKTNMPKWLMDIGLVRYIYFKLNPISKGNWPSWIQKTDETRIQTCAKKLMEHYNEPWYISEKLDGQSATYFTYHKRVWGILLKKFGVASRSVWRKTEDNSSYWTIAREYNLNELMKEVHEDIVLQGEICGPSIQKNKYKLNKIDFYLFNVFTENKQQGLVIMKYFADKFGLKTVPILRDDFIPAKEFGEIEVSDVIKALVKMSIGDSVLLKRKREGFVFRLMSDPSISFKVINPEFSVEEDKAEDKE